jgi:hypothetical protein
LRDYALPAEGVKMFVYSQPSSNNKIEKISDNEYKI